MVADIFEQITEALTGMIGALGSGIQSAVSLIYNATTGEITVFGTLCLVVVGVGVAYFCFRLLRGLIHLRG